MTRRPTRITEQKQHTRENSKKHWQKQKQKQKKTIRAMSENGTPSKKKAGKIKQYNKSTIPKSI